MKKICLPLAILLVASHAYAEKAFLYNTPYINNQKCLEADATTCGDAELGKRDPDTIDILPWAQYPLFEDLHNRSGRIDFSWTLGKNYQLPANPSEGIALKTREGQDTAYRLMGFDKAWFTLQTVTVHWVNGVPGGEAARRNTEFSGEQVLRGISLSLHLPRNEKLHQTLVKLGGANLYLSVDKQKLAQSPNPDALLHVRNLLLPGIWLRFVGWGSDNNVDWTKIEDREYNPIIAEHARLNDRKCSLSFDPSSIDFGQLSLSSTQSGKLGVEHLTKLKINCTGFQYSDQPYQYNPPLEGNPYINGNNVIHSVVSARLTPGHEVMIDGKSKIGLTKSGSVNPNLYIEGDTTSSQECGSNTTLEIGGNLTANPNSFGGPNSDFNGFKDIYWRLCKKPGEVDSGNYTGSATISIDYK